MHNLTFFRHLHTHTQSGRVRHARRESVPLKPGHCLTNENMLYIATHTHRTHNYEVRKWPEIVYSEKGDSSSGSRYALYLSTC